MKTTKRKIQAVLTLISLTLLVFVAAAYSAAGKPSLNKKEVKALIASAKTKDDHLKLADYYKTEAARLEAEATDHDEMAEMYRKNPTPLAVKHPEAIGEGHCKEIARRFRESATKTQELATMHEEMAKTAAAVAATENKDAARRVRSLGLMQEEVPGPWHFEQQGAVK